MDPASLVQPYGRFIQTKNGRVYLEEFGPEDGIALVMVHGLGGSTFSFRQNAAAFAAAGYRVLVLDLPGFGLSEKGISPDYSHPAQAETLRAVMDSAGVGQAVLLGHSMGANIILHFAKRYPERTLAIVTAAGAPMFKTGRKIQSLFLHFAPLARAGRVALRHLVNRERVRGLLGRAVANSATVSEAMVDGYYVRLTTGDWSSALIAMMVAYPGNKLDLDLTAITMPMLLIAGGKDRWVPLSQTLEWASGLPTVRCEVMIGAGHLLMDECPGEFNRLVLDFLASIQ